MDSRAASADVKRVRDSQPEGPKYLVALPLPPCLRSGTTYGYLLRGALVLSSVLPMASSLERALRAAERKERKELDNELDRILAK